MNESPSSEPHLVMIVPNVIEGDSRVIKVAASAVRAGYRVTVVGAAGRHARGATLVGGAVGARVPVEYLSTILHARWAGRAQTAHTRLLRALDRDERSASRTSLIGTLPARIAGRAWRDRTRAHRRRVTYKPVERGHRTIGQRIGYGARVVLSHLLPAAGWRITWPWYVDLEDSFVPVLLGLQPDLIHVHDVPLLPAAVSASRILRRRGTPTALVYDAHEWWPGVQAASALGRRAATAVEASHIKQVDAVMTVGPVLADRLQSRHRLATRPAVVENCPEVESVPAEGRRPLREEIGLAEGVPLLVYAGAVAVRRGLHTAVESLPALPGVHLAIVCGRPESPHVRSVVEEAERLGVDDRVHVRPYVPAEAITWYVGGADIGIVPSHRTPSHDSAIPTKVSEYVQAGLPIVGSNCTAMAQFLESTGVGKVFPQKDSDAFVAAVREVLADPQRFRGAITPELRAARSWEAQESALFDVYRSLVAEPSQPVVDGPSSSLVVVGGGFAGADALVREGVVETVVVARRPRATAAISGYVVKSFASALRARAVYYEGLRPGFGPLIGHTIEDEVRLIRQAGVECAALVSALDLSDLSLMAKLRAHGCHLLVLTPDLLPLVKGGRWMPYVPDDAFVGTSLDSDPGVLLHRVTDVEERSLVAVAASAGVPVHRHDEPLTPSLLEKYSIVVVGGMELGVPSPSMVQAMAAGRTVIADVPPAVRDAVVDLPIVSGGDLDKLLLSTLSEGTQGLNEASAAYVARRHTRDGAARVLAETLAIEAALSVPREAARGLAGTASMGVPVALDH